MGNQLSIKNTFQRILLLVVAMLLLATTFTIFNPNRAAAASCSGTSCNYKDPAATGCNANAYIAKRLQVRKASDNAVLSGVYFDVYYSNTCGTNWARFSSNPYCGKAVKAIDVAKAGGASERETDTTCGASYSMQVYAPGTTAVQVWGQLFDTSGKIKAYVTETVIS